MTATVCAFRISAGRVDFFLSLAKEADVRRIKQRKAEMRRDIIEAPDQSYRWSDYTSDAKRKKKTRAGSPRHTTR
jgi:hypothetical protein